MLQRAIVMTAGMLTVLLLLCCIVQVHIRHVLECDHICNCGGCLPDLVPCCLAGLEREADGWISSLPVGLHPGCVCIDCRCACSRLCAHNACASRHRACSRWGLFAFSTCTLQGQFIHNLSPAARALLMLSRHNDAPLTLLHISTALYGQIL